MVSRVEAGIDEPEWCLNIKKGVVSVLQLDMRQERPLSDVEPELADIVMQNRVAWDWGKSYDKAYRVLEVRH